jgi:hypothetical protein
MPDSDPWHYHRKELTQQYLDQLDSRLTQAVVLFGPRRTGKTEFLLRDLGPAARAMGWKVAYASLWQSRLAPLGVLIHALTTAHKKGSLAGRAQELARAARPKVKLSGTVPGSTVKAEAEIDLAAPESPPPADLLLHLDDCFERFAPKSRRALLMLDEVQELAGSDENGPLIAALRTCLDKRKDRLSVVFTGSSQDGLRAMFSRRDAPFFHYGVTADWPPFDDGFVTFSLAAFAKIVRAKLDGAECLKAFHTLDRNPYYFRKLLETLAFDPERNVKAALASVHERAALDLRYPETWRALSPLQRATALALAERADKPFSQATAGHIGARLKAAPPSRAQIQAAIRALVRADIISKPSARAEYIFNDPEFARWMRANAPGA